MTPPRVERRAGARAASARFTRGRRFALAWIQARQGRGVPPDSILVLGLGRSQLDQLTAWLSSAGVPAAGLSGNPSAGSVSVSTIHGAKGLDASHVLLVGGHELETRGDEEGRRLLYIAMTRASEEACVCYHGQSRLMAALDATIRATPTPARTLCAG